MAKITFIVDAGNGKKIRDAVAQNGHATFESEIFYNEKDWITFDFTIFDTLTFSYISEKLGFNPYFVVA